LKQRKLIFILLLVLGVNSWIIGQENFLSAEKQVSNEILVHSGVAIQKITSVQVYTPRGSIHITNNDDLNATFPGIGTINDPIRIEGYNITASSGDLIYIRDTTFYFRISNCLLNGLTTNDWSIHFENVINATIENNHIMNTGVDGIGIYDSEYNSIVNNTISNADKGIRLESQSNFNILENNTIYDSDAGIAIIDSSNNNTVINNTLFNNNDGIWLGTDFSPPPTGSNNNSICENTICNNYHGIRLQYECNNNFLFTNTIYNNNGGGIVLRETSNNNTIDNNNIYSNNRDGIEVSQSSSNNIISNQQFFRWITSFTGQI